MSCYVYLTTWCGCPGCRPRRSHGLRRSVCRNGLSRSVTRHMPKYRHPINRPHWGQF